jgi:guanylate kinase
LVRISLLSFANHLEIMSGKLIIITAPSGSGKTSITRYLLSKYPKLAFSVSAATRSPRGKEKDGVDYYFMPLEEFEDKIQKNEFIEWEMVYEGNYYGTLKTEIERIWAQGKTPMLDIDVKGAIHVQRQFPDNSLTLFVQPPSVDELRKRLEGRGTDTPENIETRLSKAAYELSFNHSFDKVIVNDNLEKACKETDATIQAFVNID